MRNCILIFTIMIMYGCFDAPKDFVAPEFQTDMSLQVMQKTYTLKEIIEKDTSKIKWYKSGTNAGLLYYAENISIEPIDLSDKISIDEFSQSVSQKIGNLKLDNLTDIGTTVLLTDWIPAIGYGNTIFPEHYKDVTTSFSFINQFISAKFSNVYSTSLNKLTVKITNNFPVDIILKGMTIVNTADQSEVVKKGDVNASQDWIRVYANTEKPVEFSLAGKTVKDALEFKARIYTAGSFGEKVPLNESSKMLINVSFSNELQIETATAKLPLQNTVTKSSTITPDDSTKIKNALIESGSFVFDFKNSLNTELNLNLAIPSLKKTDGSFFQKTITVSPKSSVSVYESSLKNWELWPDNNGKIEYTYSFTAKNNNNYVVISSEDSVSVKAGFSKIIFSKISGQLKPTKNSIDLQPTKLNFNDIGDNLGYSNLTLKDAKVKLNIKTSALVDIKIDGYINVKYKNTGTIKKEALNILLPVNSPVIIDISNLISGNSGKLPDEFFISGTTTINPFYKSNISVSNKDTIGGTAGIEIPLHTSIAGGTFRDTIEMDEPDFDDEDAGRLEQADLTVELFNKIAAGGKFSGKLTDINGNVLLNIPPSPVNNTENYFTLNPATVGSSGDVTTPGYTKQVFKITGNELKLIKKSKKLIIDLVFSTASSDSGVPVKLKFTDELTIKIKADTKLNIKE